MKNRFASIDIGTNSILLLIADWVNGDLEPVQEEFRAPRLGEGLAKSGAISSDSMNRSMEVLEEYSAIIREYGVEKVHIFGTEIFRQAKNSHEFVSIVKNKFNFDIKILSGEEEALLSFIGSGSILAESGHGEWTIDIGGGSSELVYASGETVRFHRSYPVGGVQLLNRFRIPAQIDRDLRKNILDYIAESLEALPAEYRSERLTGIGGTVTTLAMIDGRIFEYNFHKVDNYRISRRRLGELYEYLNGMDLQARAKLPGMDSGRADIILPAMLVLEKVLDMLNLNEFRVSARGPRYGIIYREIAGRTKI